jgi:hypothetical protein
MHLHRPRSLWLRCQTLLQTPAAPLRQVGRLLGLLLRHRHHSRCDSNVTQSNTPRHDTTRRYLAVLYTENATRASLFPRGHHLHAQEGGAPAAPWRSSSSRSSRGCSRHRQSEHECNRAGGGLDNVQRAAVWQSRERRPIHSSQRPRHLHARSVRVAAVRHPHDNEAAVDRTLAQHHGGRRGRRVCHRVAVVQTTVTTRTARTPAAQRIDSACSHERALRRVSQSFDASVQSVRPRVVLQRGPPVQPLAVAPQGRLLLRAVGHR